MKNSMIFLLKYVTKKRWFIVGYIALILESVTPMITILMQRNLIDQVFIYKQYQYFGSILFLYAVFFFAPKLLFTIRNVTFFHISYHLQMNLTEHFLKKIYNVPTSMINKEHVGKLLNNIRNDVAEATDLGINKILSEQVKAIFTITVLGLLLISYSLVLFVVVIMVGIIYYTILNKYSARLKKYSQNIRNEKASIAITIEESISSIREIVAYNRGEWQLKRYEHKFENYFKAVIKEITIKIKIILISEPFLYGTKIIAIFFGGLYVILYGNTIGEFVVSFTLIDLLVIELGKIFELSLQSKKFISAVKCITSFMDLEETKYGSIHFTESINKIEFKNVSFSYSNDTELVLNDLSVDFPIGKKIAIVGESGCGKSTIAQLILRSYSPTKGDVCINGISIFDYGVGYTDKVSVVLQEPHFIPTSIKENIIFNKIYNQSKIQTVCMKMLCHDFISKMPNQYETLIGERGTSLSGGQKQRIALSRALIKNTDLLILDEATSALDNETEYYVQRNIDELRKDKTTIIIAHRLSTIKNADIIYVMDQGTIVEKGTHESLVNNSKIYQKLYMVQFAKQ